MVGKRVQSEDRNKKTKQENQKGTNKAQRKRKVLLEVIKGSPPYPAQSFVPFLVHKKKSFLKMKLNYFLILKNQNNNILMLN